MPTAGTRCSRRDLQLCGGQGGWKTPGRAEVFRVVRLVFLGRRTWGPGRKREREREGEVLELCHMSEQGLFVALEDAVERVKSLIYIRSLGDFSQTELIGHQLFKVVPS